MRRSSYGRRAFAARRVLGLSLAVCATIALNDCDTASPAKVWPAGTLVAIDQIPVSADELAQCVASVILVEPQWAEVNLERLAFNEIALPRAILRSRASEAARTAARRSIDEQFARIQSGAQIGPPTSAGAIGHEISGSWKEIGLLTWGVAMNLEPGAWSEVFEVPGAFMRVRTLERSGGPALAAMQLRLDTIEASYTQESAKMAYRDDVLKQHRLTIVDPAWEAIVPERTQYLMGVHQE